MELWLAVVVNMASTVCYRGCCRCSCCHVGCRLVLVMRMIVSRHRRKLLQEQREQQQLQSSCTLHLRSIDSYDVYVVEQAQKAGSELGV